VCATCWRISGTAFAMLFTKLFVKAMARLINISVVIFLSLLAFACQKPDALKTDDSKDEPVIREMSDLSVSASFDWSNTRDVFVEVLLPENNQQGLLKIEDADTKKVLFKGYRDDNSQLLTTLITIPTYIEQLELTYAGMPATIVSVSDKVYLDLSSCGSDRTICGCDDGIRTFTMQYNGSGTATIIVAEDGTGIELFNSVVTVGSTFTFNGSGTDGKMDELINFYVDGIYNATINTSCSVDIYAGDEFGSFKIITGLSNHFIPLCLTNPGHPVVLDFEGTLAYEDLWPSAGDYDFNDLVITYDFDITKNALEQIEKIDATFTIYALGASFYNGFGFTFPNVLPSQITSVSGSLIKGSSVISLASNGLEDNQSKACIIVYDDCFDLMQHPGVGTGVNTEEWAPYVEPETISLEINFMDNGGGFPAGGPVTFQQLHIGSFNPFIIVNQERGKEVHLPNFDPSSLANTDYYGRWDDDSKPISHRYYLSDRNYPWGINIPEVFDYPTERSDINKAYNHFKDWAESDGLLYPDWYKDLPSYRNNEYIFHNY